MMRSWGSWLEGGAPERSVFLTLTDSHWNLQWMKWNTLQDQLHVPAFKANRGKKTHGEKPKV